MTAYCIKSPNFNISLQPKIFEADIEYPSNTIMSVSVISNGFSGKSELDIDIKDFMVFVDALSVLYSTLNGKATVKEPYGEQFIEFSTDPTGHIHIKGKLVSNNSSQKLIFENTIDQTFLPEFIRAVSPLCEKYR